MEIYILWNGVKSHYTLTQVNTLLAIGILTPTNCQASYDGEDNWFSIKLIPGIIIPAVSPPVREFDYPLARRWHWPTSKPTFLEKVPLPDSEPIPEYRQERKPSPESDRFFNRVLIILLFLLALGLAAFVWISMK